MANVRLVKARGNPLHFAVPVPDRLRDEVLSYVIEVSPLIDGKWHVGIQAILCDADGDQSAMEIARVPQVERGEVFEILSDALATHLDIGRKLQ
jgi:hypothetical protein